MAGTRPGDRNGPSGRSGAVPRGGAIRLCRHALATREGGSLAALTLHRTEWGLEEVRRLDTTTHPRSSPKTTARQSLDRSTPCIESSGMKTPVGAAAAPKANDLQRFFIWFL